MFLSVNTVFASGSGGFNSQNSVIVYEQGKKVFNQKLACADCPLADTLIDQQVAKSLIPQLKRKGELGKKLRWGERNAVKIYLKERYKL